MDTSRQQEYIVTPSHCIVITARAYLNSHQLRSTLNPQNGINFQIVWKHVIGLFAQIATHH